MAKFNIKKDINLFDFADNQYKITKPIRLIELFAGIGSQAKALKNLNVDFEHHFVCEIEPQVVKTYNVIHGTNFKPTDITKISANDLNITNTDLYTYILTYSFPCQDLSLAGKGKGMEKGTGTRSSLLWEVERLLKECNELPQILLMENVPMVHSSENIKDFEKWLLFLESLGYKNYWKDLNAKNYGIPQNRDRCYMISLLNTNYDYTFPQPIKLKLRLKDMLEEKVDEKYFLSKSMLKFFLENSEKNKLKGNGFRFNPVNKNEAELAKTLTTRCGSRMDDNFIVDDEKVTRLGGYRQPCIVVKNATQKGYVEAYEGDCNDVGIVVLGNYSPSGHNASRIVDNSGIAPTVMENHGTVTATIISKDSMISTKEFIIGSTQKHAKISTDGICPTLAEAMGKGGGHVPMHNIGTDLRIRKLTPKECYRLMGFSDDDFDKAEKINSNTQLYKQAGNSIVVNVLMAIFKQFLN